MVACVPEGGFVRVPAHNDVDFLCVVIPKTTSSKESDAEFDNNNVEFAPDCFEF